MAPLLPRFLVQDNPIGCLSGNSGAPHTACAWLVFNVLHFTFHMRHLSVYNTMDKILNVVALSLLVLITVALFARRPEGEVMREESRKPSVGRTSGNH
ncbi:hypothetical protein ACFTY7_00945 [Streptomyces sp. NPDC057062]|uniref:hypothetical protein n=1 Tax=Streptomyces sp. NPDC057062 TaxID=3346011 RepID=UPI003635BF9C